MNQIKQALISLIIFFLLILVFGIPSALIPNPFIHYARMIPAALFDYFTLIAVSGLIAYYSFLSLNEFFYIKSLGGVDSKVFGGAVLGFFGFACPICNYLLVMVFGTQNLLIFFEPIIPMVSVLSIALLLTAIYFKRKKICYRI